MYSGDPNEIGPSFPLGSDSWAEIKHEFTPRHQGRKKRAMPDRRMDPWGAGTGQGELRDIGDIGMTGA